MKDEKEKIDYSHKIVTIPNGLSLVRLILIPIIVWAYCFLENNYLTFAILLISGLTDMVDGFIARKFNMTSDVGKILDPIADKLTQLAIFFCLMTNFYRYKLTVKFYVFLIMFSLLIVKEVVQGIDGLVLTKKCQKIYSASWFGKITSGAMFITTVIHLLWQKIPNWLTIVLGCLTMCFMIFATVMYILRNHFLIKEAENEKERNDE